LAAFRSSNCRSGTSGLGLLLGQGDADFSIRSVRSGGGTGHWLVEQRERPLCLLPSAGPDPDLPDDKIIVIGSLLIIKLPFTRI
jgi:hypothetical protein